MRKSNNSRLNASQHLSQVPTSSFSDVPVGSTKQSGLFLAFFHL